MTSTPATSAARKRPLSKGGGGWPLLGAYYVDPFLSTYRRVLPALKDLLTPQGRGRHLKTYVFTYVVDVNISCVPEEGVHSPGWPNGLIIIIVI
jgi:hypothetical protein